jgi:hypothetical protein
MNPMALEWEGLSMGWYEVFCHGCKKPRHNTKYCLAHVWIEQLKLIQTLAVQVEEVMLDSSNNYI